MIPSKNSNGTKKAKIAYLERGRKWPMFIIKYDDLSRQKFVKHVTWDVAEKMLSEINNRIELGTFNLADYTAIHIRSEAIGKAFIEYIDQRERSVQLGMLSKLTVDKDENTILLFIEFVGKNTPLAKINRTTIDDFVVWMKTERVTKYGEYFKDESIKSYLISVSAFLSWAVERGFSAVNPVKGYFKKGGTLAKRQDPKFATPEQVEALRNELSKGPAWKLDAFNFSLWTSARASEVLTVKKDDIFFFRKSEKIKTVIRFVGKGGKTRMVPVGPECAALVERRIEWLSSGVEMRAAQSRAPFPQDAENYRRRWEQGYLFHDVAHRNSLSDAVLAARRKCGIDRKITFHSARHTWATDALGQGVSLAAISKTMGHSETRTTEIYAKLVDDAVLNAFENVAEI